MFRILLFLMLTGSCRGRIAEELLKEEPPLPAPVPPPPPPPALPSPPASPPPAHLCWSAPRELCPDGPLGCTRIDQSSVLCCDVDSFRLKEGLAAEMNQTILNLHILNATLDELNVSQPIWRRLDSMSITDGNIKEIVGEFLRNSPASCLNISNNGIQSITAPRALVNLYKLTTLDMSKNNLKVMPNFNGRQRHFALDIKGNNEMLCKSVLDALERYSKGHLNFINVNTTFCASSKTFHWFNSTELVPIRQVEVIHELQYNCPDVSLGGAKCQCDMVRVDIVPGKPPTFSVGVDCSNRQLKELPNRLPPNTIQLNVSYNNITSLAPLIDNPSYEQMRELYADNNNIQSIVELEGTKFIDNFMILTLRANKLKSLPTYILSNTFDRNLYAKTIHLANNYLHCDCTSAKVLKGWLVDKTKYIPDYEEIYCENNPAQQQRVIDLMEKKMCQQQRDWTDYIFYVIALEIVLLLGLVTKVTYDYWVFKSVGYLPWPASKMPKLPCDWLCE